MPALRLLGGALWQSQGQNAVLIGCLDFLGLYVGQIHSPGITAVAALLTEVMAFFYLLLLIPFRPDGEEIPFHIQVNVFFLKPWQLSFQEITVAFVADIHAEIRKGAFHVVPQAALHVIKITG